MSPKFATVLALVMVGPAFAGEVAKGEVDFKKRKSCHSVISPDGSEIQKNAARPVQTSGASLASQSPRTPTSSMAEGS